MSKKSMLLMLSALMVSGLAATGSESALANCGSRNYHRVLPRQQRIYRRTYVSQRIIRQPIIVNRTISQPAVVERVVTRPAVVERVITQPVIVKPARRGLIPGIYRFIFGG